MTSGTTRPPPAATRKARLVKQAGFPRTKRIEDFYFAANPNVPPALVHTLAKGAWIRAGQPVCLIGDSGQRRTFTTAS